MILTTRKNLVLWVSNSEVMIKIISFKTYVCRNYVGSCRSSITNDTISISIIVAIRLCKFLYWIHITDELSKTTYIHGFKKKNFSRPEKDFVYQWNTISSNRNTALFVRRLALFINSAISISSLKWLHDENILQYILLYTNNSLLFLLPN